MLPYCAPASRVRRQVYGRTAEDAGRSVGVFWGFRLDLPRRSAVRKATGPYFTNVRLRNSQESRRIAELSDYPETRVLEGLLSPPLVCS